MSSENVTYEQEQLLEEFRKDWAEIGPKIPPLRAELESVEKLIGELEQRAAHIRGTIRCHEVSERVRREQIHGLEHYIFVKRVEAKLAQEKAQAQTIAKETP